MKNNYSEKQAYTTPEASVVMPSVTDIITLSDPTGSDIIWDNITF